MSAEGFWLRLLGSLLLALAVKGVAALAHLWMPWWLAAVIGLLLVFGGWLLIVIVEDS